MLLLIYCIFTSYLIVYRLKQNKGALYMIILIGGQKGGCGKTNIATNLSAYLVQEKNIDLILIDTDKTQNSSGKWAKRRQLQKDSVNVNSVHISDNVAEEVRDLDKRYELVIIDSGGRDSIEFRTALCVADICIIPFSPSQHDIDTLPLVNDLIEQSKIINPKLKAWAMFSNCPQNKGAREKRIKEIKGFVFDDLEQIELLETVIVNRIAYTDTASSGLGVTEGEDKTASNEIKQLAKEVLKW